MRPPETRDHSTAFLQIFAVMLLITVLWTGWVVDEQLKQVADPVRELQVAR
jgi:hypothetical protein